MTHPMPAGDALPGSLAEAENWLRRVAEIVDPAAGSRKALVLMGEYDRLKAVDAAVAPVIERLAEMDDEDLADLHCVAPTGFVESLVALLKSAAIVERGTAS